MKKIMSLLAGLVVISSATGTIASCNVPSKENPNANDNALYTFLTELQDLDTGSGNNIFTIPNATYNQAAEDSVKDYLSSSEKLNLAQFNNRFQIETQAFSPIVQGGSDKNFLFAPGTYSFKVKDTLSNQYIQVNTNHKQIFDISFFTRDVLKTNSIKNNLITLNHDKVIPLASFSIDNLLDSFTSVFGIDFKQMLLNIINSNPNLASLITSFLSMPISNLISLVKVFLPTLTVDAPLPTIIPTNPTFDDTGMLQDQTWENFYNVLQAKVGSLINSSNSNDNSNLNNPFSFSNIIIPSVSKSITKSIVSASVTSQESNLQILINSLAPDIIHFFHFCNNLPANSDYTLAAIRYFLSATTKKFGNDDNMSNVNVDLVNDGEITTNLDNLLFDLFGNEQIAISQQNKINVAWHHDNKSITGAKIPFSFTMKVTAKIFSYNFSRTLQLGYFNSEFYDSSNSLTLIQDPLFNVSSLFKEFISGLFFSQSNDTNLLNNKIDLFELVNMNALMEGIIGDNTWWIPSFVIKTLSQTIKTIIEAVISNEYHNIDIDNISMSYFYEAILNNYLIANDSDLSNYSLSFLVLNGGLTTSNDDKNFHLIANLQQLLDSNDKYWQFKLSNVEGQYLYNKKVDVLLNCNFNLQNIAFTFV